VELQWLEQTRWDLAPLELEELKVQPVRLELPERLEPPLILEQQGRLVQRGKE
jgi:hypothetical protein